MHTRAHAAFWGELYYVLVNDRDDRDVVPRIMRQSNCLCILQVRTEAAKRAFLPRSLNL